MLLEALISPGTEHEHWHLVQEKVRSVQHAVSISEAMSAFFQFRLRLDNGDYLYGDWIDDPNDNESCVFTFLPPT